MSGCIKSVHLVANWSPFSTAKWSGLSLSSLSWSLMTCCRMSAVFLFLQTLCSSRRSNISFRALTLYLAHKWIELSWCNCLSEELYCSIPFWKLSCWFQNEKWEGQPTMGAEMILTKNPWFQIGYQKSIISKCHIKNWDKFSVFINCFEKLIQPIRVHNMAERVNPELRFLKKF